MPIGSLRPVIALRYPPVRQTANPPPLHARARACDAGASVRPGLLSRTSQPPVEIRHDGTEAVMITGRRDQANLHAPAAVRVDPFDFAICRAKTTRRQEVGIPIPFLVLMYGRKISSKQRSRQFQLIVVRRAPEARSEHMCFRTIPIVEWTAQAFGHTTPDPDDRLVAGSSRLTPDGYRSLPAHGGLGPCPVSHAVSELCIPRVGSALRISGRDWPFSRRARRARGIAAPNL